MATRYTLKFKSEGLNWTLVWHPEFDDPIEWFKANPHCEVIEEEV